MSLCRIGIVTEPEFSPNPSKHPTRFPPAIPEFFIKLCSRPGDAICDPFAPPLEFRPMRLGKKIEAGAEFVQTQICFNLSKMRLFMARCADLGLLEQVCVLAGVFVPRSAKAVRYLRDQVPGIDVPDEVVDRLDSVPPDRQRAEGIGLALDIVEQVRAIPGVSGLHLMTIRNEEAIVEVIERAGLLPRPSSVPQTVG